LFTSFTGLDFERDPAAAAKLDRYICWVQHVVTRLEGVLVQLTLGEKGSYFYAAWGAPVAHEDDTRRACTAALEFVQPPPEIAGLGLTARVGITSGTMRTGAYGSRQRRTYGLLGDDTNLAARLMARAGPAEILVSAQAARRQLDAFDLLPLPPVTVKGKQEPVPLFRLQGRRQPGPHLRAPSAPMLGRQHELTQALAKLRLAAAGRGQVLALSAEAGLGKSRLLAEIVHESAGLGFTALAGDCPALGRDAAYSGWTPIWRAFFQLPADVTADTALASITRHLPPDDPGLLARAPLLGPLLNLALPDNDLTRPLDARTRRSSLEGLLVECLRHRAQSGPVLLVLDECHWIDEASRTLLGTLLPAIARLPVAILLAHRPVQPGEVIAARDLTLDHVTTLELGDLPPGEARQLIAHKLAARFGADAAPAAFIDRIAARAGGNPFFIEEVANLLQARGVDPRDPRAAETLELPESLHSLVLGRIDQLSEDARTSLKIASVIGRIFRTAVLFGVHPLERVRASLPAQLAELQQRDLATPEPGTGDDTYFFRHIVIQEVAYESLPFGFRATVHETIGRHLEQLAAGEVRPWVDLLAFHFGRSHCLEKKRHYLVAAGDAARAAHALESAIGHYQRALELLTGDERIPILTRVGEVLELTGRWNDAFARYHEARDLAERAGRTTEQAALAGAVGDLHRRRGEFDAAETWIGRAREENAVLGNDAGVALMLHLEGTLCAQTGKFARATGLFHRALAIRERLGDAAATAKTLNNLGIVARSQGDIDTALAHYERSLAIRRQVNDRREIANSLNNLGFTHRFRRDFARARELLAESVELNRAVGDRWSTANALTSLAELALDTGDAALAERCLRESITINRELGDRRALAFLLEGVGRLAVLQDDPAAALRFFTAARGLRDNIGAPLEPADAQALATIVEAARARVDPALHHRLKAEALRLPLGEVVDQALALCAAPARPTAIVPPGSH
jgi:adenylate cyclase